MRWLAACWAAVALLWGGSTVAAEWITAPDAKAPTVLHFRCDVSFIHPPKVLWAHVSADNRFVLYVNGKRVADGPATSDLAHWRYRRVDL
ncbi:MAG: hypothetical protein ACXU8U_10665, partial [Asticcacaulis sp.]